MSNCKATRSNTFWRKSQSVHSVEVYILALAIKLYCNQDYWWAGQTDWWGSLAPLGRNGSYGPEFIHCLYLIRSTQSSIRTAGT